MSDILSNFFSHLKNAQQSRILVIEHPQSKLILSLLNILQECGYIRGYRMIVPNNGVASVASVASLLEQSIHLNIKPFTFPKVEILLKYKNQKPAINKILRISKPSKRVYLSVKKLSHILTKKTNNQISFSLGDKMSSLLFMKGILILSTSQGIMTHLTAYRLNIGGEVLCHIS
jgi:small subunit ribosomal protein S8